MKNSGTEGAFTAMGETSMDLKEGDYLIWDGQSKTKMNPNYKNTFNTQHRGNARACGNLQK
jgi:hypothetical protein